MTEPAILVSGETLVDLLPDRPGPLRGVERFTRRAGGAPANVAIALARLGVTPYFHSRIATDPFGEFLAGALADAGVPARFVTRDPERRTGLAFVSHDDDADRGFTFFRERSADTALDDAVVPDEVLADLEYVYVGGVLLPTEPARTSTFSLVERAGAQGCAVFFDPNYRPELWPDDDAYRTTLDRMLALADVVKATPEDFAASRFADDDPLDVAAGVAEAGPHTVFLTRGAAGATAVATDDAPWPSGTVTHRGYPVDPVDTTGAGDAFTAGVLAALATDVAGQEAAVATDRAGDGSTPGPGDVPSLGDALDFANAVAAFTTTAEGAITALPDRAAVRAFRERHG